MAEVRLQEGELVENVLRRFKCKVIAEDIIKEVKRHSFYLKPGEKRRVKQAWRESAHGKRFAKNRNKVAIIGMAATFWPTSRVTVSKHEDTMSKHDTATKRHRRPKSRRRVDYTARTMAALKALKEAAKLKNKAG